MLMINRVATATATEIVAMQHRDVDDTYQRLYARALDRAQEQADEASGGGRAGVEVLDVQHLLTPVPGSGLMVTVAVVFRPHTVLDVDDD